MTPTKKQVNLQLDNSELNIIQVLKEKNGKLLDIMA